MRYQPDFDHDRLYGEAAEGLVEELRFLGERIETKRKSYRDLKLYVETEHRPRRVAEYRPSGLCVTKSEYFAYVIADTGVTVFVPVSLLEEYIRLGFGEPKEERDGDNPTRGILVDLAELVSF